MLKLCRNIEDTTILSLLGQELELICVFLVFPWLRMKNSAYFPGIIK